MKKLFDWFKKKPKGEEKELATFQQTEIEKAKLEYERINQLEKDISACNLYLYPKKDIYRYMYSSKVFAGPGGGILIGAGASGGSCGNH